jgi:hypothetical protein
LETIVQTFFNFVTGITYTHYCFLSGCQCVCIQKVVYLPIYVFLYIHIYVHSTSLHIVVKTIELIVMEYKNSNFCVSSPPPRCGLYYFPH